MVGVTAKEFEHRNSGVRLALWKFPFLDVWKFPVGNFGNFQEK